MPFQPNQLIGPCALERQLGRGTFGEVWLAIHQDLGERRALKIPTDPRYVQQLRREGRIIYSLQHENIVRGCDMNTLNDPPYVAMEYIEGVTLRPARTPGAHARRVRLATQRRSLWSAAVSTPLSHRRRNRSQTAMAAAWWNSALHPGARSTGFIRSFAAFQIRGRDGAKSRRKTRTRMGDELAPPGLRASLPHRPPPGLRVTPTCVGNGTDREKGMEKIGGWGGGEGALALLRW